MAVNFSLQIFHVLCYFFLLLACYIQYLHIIYKHIAHAHIGRALCCYHLHIATVNLQTLPISSIYRIYDAEYMASLMHVPLSPSDFSVKPFFVEHFFTSFFSYTRFYFSSTFCSISFEK